MRQSRLAGDVGLRIPIIAGRDEGRTARFGRLPFLAECLGLADRQPGCLPGLEATVEVGGLVQAKAPQ